MAHQELQRPLFFNVQRVRGPQIGIINQQEWRRVDDLVSQHSEQNEEEEEDEDDAERRRQTPPLPAGALPIVRSPRPEKQPAYIPKPTKTPQYFRWKRRPLLSLTTSSSSHQSPPSPVNKGPSAPSPRIKRQMLKRPPSIAAPTLSMIKAPKADAIRPAAPERPKASLSAPTAAPASAPASASVPATQSTTPVVEPAAPTPPPTSFLFEETQVATPTTPGHGTRTPLIPEPLSPLPKAKEESRRPENAAPTSATPVAPTPLEELLAAPRRMAPVASAVLFEEEKQEKSDPNDVIPIVLKLSDHQQPQQERMIAKHVLRGQYLRKYLHINNITRKLKETEQLLRSNALHAGIRPIDVARPSAKTPPSSILGKSEPVVPEEVRDGRMPVLRRLSSIDRAINKTVKKIRRIAGTEPATTKPPTTSPPTNKRSVRGIPEPRGAGDHSFLDEELDDEEEPDVTMAGAVRIDPTSAHFVRICQHVIAKRAIKSFLRQELSVITQIETALIDDKSMHRSTSNDKSNIRVPIKSLNASLLESLTVYLQEGDQHMTLDELFATALTAERTRLWKRAILLASACIVIDREHTPAVLLRARCCRRLGLWTQAIKDLSHALLLHPEAFRLFLLRAFLFVKMSDFPNALDNVNRALMLHPKSIEALLLRADIFHRHGAIGLSLQDLTSVLTLDPSCWRAYYDRATIRTRAIEGDEQSFVFHWEHMKYEQLLASIIEDYVNALRKGCQMVEVVETIGDLTVRLLEFLGDLHVVRQVIHNLTHLTQILSIDPRASFLVGNTRDPKQSSRDLLLAAIYTQRGRLHVLLNDKANALADLDQAVVTDYHYAIAHFYRGAYASLSTTNEDATKTNLLHLTRCIALDPTIAGAYTVRGALYLRDLKFNSALQDFKAAVATDPTLYEVWLQIALIYLNHYHDCDACIKACSSALTNDSCLARALYLRGEALSRQGNVAAALKDYGRLTMAQPNDRWAQLMRGRLLLQMKLPRPALYAFIQFMEMGAAGGDKNAHLLCGRAFKLLSRFRKAVDEFQRAVSLNPTSENLVLLSESLHSMGDTENSLRVSEQVINADPGSYKGYVRRAQLLVSIGQFQRAMAEYDKALFLAPKEGRVIYERGIVQMQLYLRWRVALQLQFEPKTTKKKKRSPFAPQLPAIEVELALGADAMSDEATVRKMLKTYYVGAIADFCKCIRFEPSMAEPYVDRAELYVLGEDYDKAFRDFETAVEKNPKCCRAYVNMGVLKCQFMAFAAAIDDFDKAIRNDPQLELAFFNRGVSYQRLGLWKHAEKSYDRCIELSGVGRNIDAHRNRAIARCQLNDFEGALADFDEVRQSAPDDDQLHGGLGFVLLQLGRYEDAAKCFAAYGRLSRDTFVDSGNAYFNLGTRSQQLLEQTKHTQYLKTALKFYIRAVRLDPSNADIRLNVANCLRKLRDPVQSIRQCDVIAGANPHNHACLESKALAYYQMLRHEDAIESMDAAIRACVASSAALENIFYAFASESIHRNTLERKTVANANSISPERAMTPSRDDIKAPLVPKERERLTNAEVIMTGSAKQMLSLYMMNRGILFEKMGRWADARSNYRDAIHFDSMSVNALVCMGTLDLMEADYGNSIEHLQKALSIDPTCGIAHINLGVVFMSVDNLAEALKHFDLAIQLLPKCSYAYSNKAVALTRMGDLKEAESHFKRAIEELPSRKEYYLARGKIIAQQKRLQDAMVDFSTALYLGYEGKL